MPAFLEQKRSILHDHLRRHVSGEVRFDPTTRKLYSTDASIYQIEPLGVVLPKNVADLQATVQIALEMHIPIVPRGGGTSLSGQSIGPGVVIDCSKYLNHVLDIDPVGRKARVQPGVVLDQLNRSLAPHGLQFGPDVATASRATLGGMIGNNSAGSHSIVHGKTLDHVRNLDAFLRDGKRHRLHTAPGQPWRRQDPTLTEELEYGLRKIVGNAHREIDQRFPNILRRVSGYNLDRFARSPDSAGLHHLFIGSEGTLGVLCEAELNLVPTPKAVGILIPQFSSLDAAMEALAICLEMQPSAVELLDALLLRVAKQNLALRNTMAALTGVPEAIFMVEFSADTVPEVTDRIEKLQRKLQGRPGVIATLPAIDAKERQPLWNLRNAAVPLLLGLPGDRKPLTFVEDTAVAPERLPSFVQRFRAILKAHGTDGAFYGHASVGCLHIRPLLNIQAEDDRQRMRRIMEDITDLVLEFGGSLSGEHGDGLARSEWNRKMFGDAIYQAFCQVKELFDPHHLFNPGKIVHAPPMTDHLRMGANYRPFEPDTIFDYTKQEGFVRSIELCNGSGVCRKTQGGTMCPSYRATRDEKDSTRGRANALRLALDSPNPVHELRSSWLHDVLDLCLQCKACKSECPSNVDLAKLKAEFLQSFYQGRQRPLSHRLMGKVHRWYRLGSNTATLVNWLQKSPLVRWFLESAAGIDRRRSLPELQGTSFRRWFFDRRPRPKPGTKGKVLLLDDCFTNFLEPRIGQAAVEILEAGEITVRLAGIPCCGRSLISKGYLREARDLIQPQVARLAQFVEQGWTILGIEPSCLLALVDEWPDLVPSPATRKIAAASRLADAWIAERLAGGDIVLPLKDFAAPCVVHGHCHQKALVGTKGTLDLLRQIHGLDVKLLETGCCGMAGSFGFETRHYELSVAIANLELIPALQQNPDALVVAPGTSCRHQIRDLTPRHALHPLEVIADRLRMARNEVPDTRR